MNCTLCVMTTEQLFIFFLRQAIWGTKDMSQKYGQIWSLIPKSSTLYITRL